MTRYLPLLEQLDRWQDRARERHPDVIPCRKGCAACCHGPFDISVADAAQVVGAFRALDPELRERVGGRAARQVEAMRVLEPGWTAPHAISAIGEARFDRVSDALAADPCPMLEQGGCAIYRDRPMICRLMGLGMLTEVGDVIENGCPIQDQFPVYQALAPEPFPLELWEVGEEAANEAAAAARTDGAGPDFETSIAAAIVHACLAEPC